MRKAAFLATLIAGLLAYVAPVAASTVTYGSTDGPYQDPVTGLIVGASSVSCVPFGCPAGNLTIMGVQTSVPSPLNWPPEYQQVYSSTQFSTGSHVLTSVTFYVAHGPTRDSNIPNSGHFQISLSTTSAPVFIATGPVLATGLNLTNLSSNIGSNNVVVYNGALPPISGGALTITFTTPFTYVQNAGNLLMDVVSTDVTNSNPFFLYLAVNPGAPRYNVTSAFETLFSQAWQGMDPLADSAINTFGLVTTFSY